MELWATGCATGTKVYRVQKETWKNNGSKTCPSNVDTKYENTTCDSENPWAIGRWKILGQHGGIMIHIYFILALLSAKSRGREQQNFLLLKSKHRPGLHCLSPPPPHYGFWDNGRCCPCFQVLWSFRGCYSTWAPPGGLSTPQRWRHHTAGCLASHSCFAAALTQLPQPGSLDCSQQQLKGKAAQEAKAAVMAALALAWPYTPGDLAVKQLGCWRSSNVVVWHLVLPCARIQPALVDQGQGSLDIQHRVVFFSY